MKAFYQLIGGRKVKFKYMFLGIALFQSSLGISDQSFLGVCFVFGMYFLGQGYADGKSGGATSSTAE